jgi:signal transduction histidine kinase
MTQGGSQAEEGPDDWLRGVADQLSDGVLWSPNGRVVWVNDALRQLAGAKEASDLEGRPLGELFEDSGSGVPSPERFHATSEFECRLRRRTAPPRSVRVRCWAAASGMRAGVWIVEDIATLRGLEEEILHTSRALHDANRELAALRERHRREASEREQILNVVSHELRTPVTVIAGYARLLLTEKVGPLNEEQRRFLSESAKSCQRLSSFIGNLLEAAREISADSVLEVCETSLAPTIEGVVTFLKPLLEEHQLEIRLALHPDGPRARFDPLRIEQVLTNLLGNAIKYARAGGMIEILTREVRMGSGPSERPGVEVSVADDGPGVSAEDRQRIFEPYVRAGEASRAGGLGLGLAICKRIVEAHGGEIRVTDRAEGQGACFSFTLPAAESAPGNGA